MNLIPHRNILVITDRWHGKQWLALKEFTFGHITLHRVIYTGGSVEDLIKSILPLITPKLMYECIVLAPSHTGGDRLGMVKTVLL